ncbi:MAG TPA: VOC family protein [Acidimicrobiales bacterium]|nr:VOC family protein [Acidimicrobiales bacterium]
MRVTRILHHSVNVEGRLAEAEAFYRGLNLPGLPRPHIPGVEGRWLRAGSAQVHLVDAPAGGSAIRPTGPHVCFGVEDLDGAIAELERDGVPYVRGVQGEVVQIWVADPAGNTVELQQDPDLAAPSGPPSRPDREAEPGKR